MSRWNCRICKVWGLGGPKAWVKHFAHEHAEHPNRFSAHVSFGFTGDYASGRERRYDRTIAPAVAAVRGDS